MLSPHMIIKDHERTLARALESLRPLGRVTAVDVGCTDESYRLCQRYGAQVLRLSLDSDYSAVRNEVVRRSTAPWQFYLEPWEVLVSGHEDIRRATTGPIAAYRVQCIQGDLLTKEIRLWHKGTGLLFQNPVFESLVGPATDLNAVILVEAVNRYDEARLLLRKWKEERPLAMEPYYYDACALLAQRKWDEFLTVAQHYLFHERQAAMATTLTRYYCAMVQSYIKKDYRQALRNILTCLAVKPLMAEFWCLLADIYYAQKDYERAATFYRNARVLGSRRLRSDDWPLEIPKYQDYPTRMLESCQRLLDGQVRITCLNSPKVAP